jgi:hypothetical protein
MQPERDTELMRELLEQWIRLGELLRDLQIATLTPAGGGPSLASEYGIEPLGDRAASLGIDRDAFVSELREYVQAAMAGSPGANAAAARVAAQRAEVARELAAHPAGIERAETLLRVLADTGTLEDSEVEAYADPAVDLRNAQRQALARSWREQWLEGREQRRLLAGEAFWVSADFQDHYDDVAYFRVYERYGFGEFDELFDDVAKTIGERLVDGLASGDPFGRYQLGAATALSVAEHLWLTSRSHRLRRRLHATAQAAVAALFHSQHADGYWPAPVAGEGGTHPPSAEATAMAVIAGRRISRDDHHTSQSQTAVGWLLAHQQTDGSWRDFRNKPDVAATALALDAIARSRRENVGTACQRAADWLIGQQAPTGTWAGTLPSVLLCVTVLDALRAVPVAEITLPDELSSALCLFQRAELLAEEDSSDARQLAVVGAYTALEAVLYALLSHPSVGATTVRANGQAIGFDQALVDIEAAFVTLGHLATGRHVVGHNVLRTLTHVRDGVVHRGTQPAAGDTERIIRATTTFCHTYVPLLFGVDPLAD